jgi:predicted phage-related endonuclease
MEDAARRAFEQRHRTCVLPLCAEHDAHATIRASFDGIDDDGCPVELKVPWRTTFADLVAENEQAATFKLYWVQVQCQIAVAGAPKGWLVFDPCVRGVAAVEYAIARDDPFIDGTLTPGCLAFWERIKKKKEPLQDPTRDIFIPRDEDLATWTVLAGAYRDLAAAKVELDAQVKQAKAKMDGIEDRLVPMMGEFLLAETAGIKVLRYCQRGSIDYKEALAEREPDIDPTELEQYRRASCECVKVTALTQERATVPFAAARIETAAREGEAHQGFFF